MRKLKKSLLILSMIPLMLNSCGKTMFNQCLETSDTQFAVENYCYQVNKNDVINSFYLISKPMETEEENPEIVYDIEWKDVLHLGLFTIVGGLKGKIITSVVKSNDHCLQVSMTHFVLDDTATFGYIKVNPTAFTINNSTIKNISIYVYVAIGEETAMIEKPETAYVD